MLFRAAEAPSLKIHENHDGDCLGSRAASCQKDGLHGFKDPAIPFGGLITNMIGSWVFYIFSLIIH